MGIYLKMDAVHVLFQCPAYVQVRQKYGLTEPIYQPNWSLVRNTLAREDEPKIINLSKFPTLTLDTKEKKKNRTRVSSEKSACIVLLSLSL